MKDTIQDRCKHYNTTSTNCSCMGFIMRKYCKHIKYLQEQKPEQKEMPKIEIVNAQDAVSFVDEYSEDILNQLKQAGEVFEKQGKLYKI